MLDLILLIVIPTVSGFAVGYGSAYVADKLGRIGRDL